MDRSWNKSHVVDVSPLLGNRLHWCQTLEGFEDEIIVDLPTEITDMVRQYHGVQKADIQVVSNFNYILCACNLGTTHQKRYLTTENRVLMSV